MTDARSTPQLCLRPKDRPPEQLSGMLTSSGKAGWLQAGWAAGRLP